VALTPTWLVHAVLPGSVANGPGRRFVIWSQGCTLGCAGCFNPDTHPLAPAAQSLSPQDVLHLVLAERASLEGVTLTGGEPLEQPEAVADFGRRLKAHSDLGIILLTGFTRTEIESDPARAAAVASVDLVVAGRYVAARRLASGLRGSTNKAYWFRTDRYTVADLTAVPEVEIQIGVDGSLVLTGMMPT